MNEADLRWSFGDHEAWWDEAKDTFFVRLEGMFTPEHNEMLSDATLELTSKVGAGKNVVFLAANGEQDMSRRGRELMKKAAMRRKGAFAKQAVVGVRPAHRMFAKIMMKLTGERDYDFFATAEEAMAWFAR